MSAGPAEDSGAPAPEPATPERAASIGELLAEQRKAAEAGNWAEAARLNREIGLLSLGTGSNPLRETTSGGRAHVAGSRAA